MMVGLRKSLGLALAGALFFAAGPAPAGGKRPVVVELYTSQGCNTCPPADALLGRLAERKDIIAMSLPITYWDMLGWKDTLASEANTRRQKAYAEAMGRGGVYTPQMIVDGISDVVGGREAAVEAAIDARQADMRAIPVALNATPQTIHVAIGAGPIRTGEEDTIWMFRIAGKATVNIGAGENEGHSLTYYRIVREVKAIGLWRGQALTIDLPRTEAANAARDTFAVVVQQGGYGRIVGAAAVSGPD
jgi:hypothetical protein